MQETYEPENIEIECNTEGIKAVGHYGVAAESGTSWQIAWHPDGYLVDQYGLAVVD